MAFHNIFDLISHLDDRIVGILRSASIVQNDITVVGTPSSVYVRQFSAGSSIKIEQEQKSIEKSI